MAWRRDCIDGAGVKKALLIVSLIGLAGCYFPKPVIRLYPENTQTFWRAGRRVVTREHPGYRMAIAFEESDEYVALRLEVQNTGTVPLDVDPAQMVVVSCTDPKRCSPPRPAVDPEAMLLELDVARARERAAKASDESVGVALVLLDVTAGIAASGRGDHQAAGRAQEAGGEAAADFDRTSAGHQSAISQLTMSRAQWASTALRKTTLLPTQAVGGLIYLPIDNSASRLLVGARINGEDNWFPFRQEVISTDARPVVAGPPR